VSGSGKSTLAFDILFAEGQRRYLESLNAYARQFVQPSSRPDVDSVTGVPPTVAIEQRTSRGGRKSTVATVTEIYHYLRLLFVKLGVQYCPNCNVAIQPQSQDSIVAQLLKLFRGKSIVVCAPLVTSRKGYYTDLAEWAAAKGHAHLRVDGGMVPTSTWPRLDRYREHTIELPVAEIAVSPRNEAKIRAAVATALDIGKNTVRVAPGSAQRGKAGALADSVFSTERSCPRCKRSFEELDPRLFSFNSKHGWCDTCFGTGLQIAGFDEEQTGEEIWWNEWFDGEARTCPACKGLRLRPEALAVKLRNRTIADYTDLAVAEAQKVFAKLSWQGREAEISRDLVPELASRLEFLKRVGLGYLTLDRAAPTLSGGEAQRIRLASQLGTNLRGVCYILDEPTIGLHCRDNRMLLDTLRQLAAKGNTVVVVEHDEETIRCADHVIDLGPGGGTNGGKLVGQGTVADLIASKNSVTGAFLANPLRHPLHAPRPVRQGETQFLTVKRADLHNLKSLTASIALGRFTCITGVSGSGKSTLVRDVLYDNLARCAAAGRSRRTRGRAPRFAGCAGIDGWEQVPRVLEVDQRPIGRTPRSCPSTYVGVWDEIRKLFSRTPDANLHGYTPSRFSFNVKGGRCEVCEGQGMQTIKMSFLPDVTVACEACGGKRFAPETLAVQYRGRSIGDVLAMSVDEAVPFFEAHAAIHRTLRLLQDVGLGYVRLGQQSPMLSGGEAQRTKLVAELALARLDNADARAGQGHSLYVLDEPTIGLHMADVEKLVAVLHRLVDAGNTVIVIEHNLDVIAEADWIIDLGPEGGDKGGRIVAQGTVTDFCRRGAAGTSYTARVLRDFLRRKGAGADDQKGAAPRLGTSAI
jgi:excinuclease ABC subunit A